MLVQLIDIRKAYPGVQALDGVSLSLGAGRVHGLVGENGAGKSTLIRILSGVHPPDAGSIRVEGRDTVLATPSAARRQGIVTVHQEADLFGPLSVAENLALLHGLDVNRFGLVRWGKVVGEARRAVADLGLSIDVRRPAERLTVGQRHLSQLAHAAFRPARLVILDEPTSSLSHAESEWLFARIDRWRNEGVAVLYVSHRLDEIFRLCDEVTVLRDGARIWNGPIADVDPATLVHHMIGREGPPTSGPRSTGVGSTHRPILQTRKLTDRAGRFRDVDLQVRPGEVVGLFGLVGAGRSEFAQAVFGLGSLSSGTVAIDGVTTAIHSPSQAVALGVVYLPEDRLRQGVCRGLSIRVNVVLSSLRKWSAAVWIRRSAEARLVQEQCRPSGVKYRDVEQPIGELSGGNQQKVLLARGWLTHPRCLILDEPTRGVDVGAKAQIHGLVRELAGQGAAVVWISSELPELVANADRVVVFRQGSVAGEFPADPDSVMSIGHCALPDSTDSSVAADRTVGFRLAFSPLAGAEVGLVVAIAVLCLFLWGTTDRFATSANLLGILSNSAVWVILALGATAVIVAGGIDISIGSLLALSAAVGGLILTRGPELPASVPVAIGASLMVGLLGGLLNASVALVGRIHPIVVTLGTMTIFRGMLILLTGGETLGPMPDAFRIHVTGRFVGVSGAIGIAGLVVLAMGIFLWATRAGRHLFALGSSASAARLAGISRWSAWMTAFGLGGVCAAFAGLVELAQTGSMQSVLGTGYELRAITAAVIGGTSISGGRGSAVGTALGAILLGVVQNALVLWQVSPFQYDLVIGALLLGAIAWDRVLRGLA